MNLRVRASVQPGKVYLTIPLEDHVVLHHSISDFFIWPEFASLPPIAARVVCLSENEENQCN